MRDHDAAADHQGHIQRLLLLITRGSQTIRLDDVVIDAVIAAQARGDDQAHEFLVLRRNCAFQVCVVVDVVEALDQEVVGLVNIRIQARAGLEKTARDSLLSATCLSVRR
jgi:hypothetical protein